MASMAFRFYKIKYWPGLCPDPVGGAYDAPADSIVGWGETLFAPHPLDAGHPAVPASLSQIHSTILSVLHLRMYCMHVSIHQSMTL